jgi:hypothetical protein
MCALGSSQAEQLSPSITGMGVQLVAVNQAPLA